MHVCPDLAAPIVHNRYNKTAQTIDRLSLEFGIAYSGFVCATVKYTNTHMHKYLNIQMCKCSNVQVFKRISA